MYESFYNFRMKPFSLLPDPEFLFLSSRHKAGLNLLEYGLLNRAVFTVLTGEPGTGKTTLLNKILDQSRGRFTVGVIATTHPNADSLLPWVADAFDLDCSGQDTVGHFRTVTAFLGQSFAAGRQVLLVVDEAQNLNVHMLEDLRLLSNINDGRQNSLQIILAGQPSLRSLLTGDDMKQLAQRITVDHALEPLDEAETRRYVHHRLLVAGGASDLFTDYACSVLHRLTGGTPRLINQLCDLALSYGFGEGVEHVTAPLLLQVAVDRSHGGILRTAVDPKSIVLDAEELRREARRPPPGPAAPAQSNPNPLCAAPDHSATRYRQGLDLKQAGRYREALEKFSALEHDPSFRFKAAAQRGLCQRAIGRLDDAVDSFRHALDVNGAKPADLMHVRYVLAQTLDTMGRRTEASRQYRQIHDVDPAFRDVARRLASGDDVSRFPFPLFRLLRQNWQQFKGSSHGAAPRTKSGKLM